MASELLAFTLKSIDPPPFPRPDGGLPTFSGWKCRPSRSRIRLHGETFHPST